MQRRLVGVLHARAVAVRLDDAAVRACSRRRLAARPPAGRDGAAARGCARRTRRSVPISASSDMAPATSASRASRSASSTASAPSPAMRCVPLSSARPSLVSSASGRDPGARAAPRARAARRPSDTASPSPMRQSATWASGARSPEATDRAVLGHEGCTRAVQARDQGLDDARAARRRRRARATPPAAASSRGSRPRRSAGPTPPAWLSTRLRCSVAALGRRNHDVLELADSGGDAVDRLGAAGQPIDERAAAAPSRAVDAGRERDLAAPARHVLDVAERERAAVQDQRAQIAQPFVSAATRATTLLLGDRRQSSALDDRRPCTHTSVTACGDMA